MLHYRYDIVADAWTQMANVPVNIYRPASASIGTNTYLVGGGDPSVAPRTSPQARKLASTRAPATSFNTTYVYDTLADTWSSGPNTNVAHSFTGGTAIGNSLIVVTGFDGGGDTNTVEKSDCGGGRSNANTDADGYPDCDNNCYSNSNANGDAQRPKTYSNTQAASNAAAASISRFCEESLIAMTAQGRCFAFSTPGRRPSDKSIVGSGR